MIIYHKYHDVEKTRS